MPLNSFLELALDFFEFTLLKHPFINDFQPATRFSDFKQGLFFLQIHIQKRSNPVCQPIGSFTVDCKLLNSFSVPLDLFQVAFEFVSYIFAEGNDFRIFIFFFNNRSNHGHVEGVRKTNVLESGSALCFKKCFYGTVMQPHDLQNTSNGSHPEEVFFFRFFYQRVFLGNHENLAIFRKSLFQCSNGQGSANEERCRHMREDNNVPHGQHWETNFFRGFGIRVGHQKKSISA